MLTQAFHWFANDETLRELHRILKPHGALGLIWNIEVRHTGIPEEGTQYRPRVGL